MANVCCTSNVSFSVNEDEKEVLKRAHDIIEEIRHVYFASTYSAIGIYSIAHTLTNLTFTFFYTQIVFLIF